jgi:hypothetical protein
MNCYQTAQGIIVVDAGGGTIDLSAYYVTPSLTSFQEIAPAGCTALFQIFRYASNLTTTFI